MTPACGQVICLCKRYGAKGGSALIGVSAGNPISVKLTSGRKEKKKAYAILSTTKKTIAAGKIIIIIIIMNEVIGKLRLQMIVTAKTVELEK